MWPIVKLWAQPEPVDLGNARLELVKSRLGASDQGLTQSEAQTRLKQYGYNELPEEKVNPLLKFLSYFRGPIPWMIEIAAAPGESCLLRFGFEAGEIDALVYGTGVQDI